MKAKTIEKIILKKFTEFYNSIKDESVKTLVKENSVITGGCIASMFLKEKVNDFDIYFTNKLTVKAVANYFLNQFHKNNPTQQQGYILDGEEINCESSFFDKEKYDKFFGSKDNFGGAGLNMTPDRIKIIFDSKGVAKEDNLEEDEIHELGDTIEVKDDKGENYRPIYLSGNAITLSHGVQLIIRFYGTPDQIHDNYDFAHCTNYWLSKEEKLYLNQKAIECLLSKELFYIGSKYPLASIIRIRKFVARGWQINAGQILKICFQLNELDLKDVNVLEDQLVGVDLAYFFTLIEALKAIPDQNEKQLSYGYLATIIDRIF